MFHEKMHSWQRAPAGMPIESAKVVGVVAGRNECRDVIYDGHSISRRVVGAVTPAGSVPIDWVAAPTVRGAKTVGAVPHATNKAADQTKATVVKVFNGRLPKIGYFLENRKPMLKSRNWSSPPYY